MDAWFITFDQNQLTDYLVLDCGTFKSFAQGLNGYKA